MNKINYGMVFVIIVAFFFVITSNFSNKTNKNEQLALVTPVSGGETVAVIRPSCSGYEADTCFTSLASWESSFGGINFGACTAGDLVCANTSAVAKIEGSWTSADSAVTISGWTTSSTNYIKIYTATDARHSGVWSDSKYRISSTASPIDIREKNVIIDGLQLALTGSLSWKSGVRYEPEESLLPGGTQTVSNCIIKSTNTSTSGINGINANNWDAESSVSFYNNIVYGFSNYGIYLKLLSSSSAFIYNNTVYGINGIGIETSNNTVLLKNNIVQSVTGNDYVGTAKTGSSNNISSDATTAGSDTKINQTVSFVSTNTGSEDFHLSSSDISAKDAGVGLSGDSGLAFSIDIDGETRSGTWDIGADEQTGSVPPTPPPSDTTPPTVSSPSPSGTLASGTTSTTLSVTTNETSVCKYSTTANTSYASMTNTLSASSNTHTATINNLTDGTTYNYYVKCSDTAGNITASDTSINFDIASPAPVPDPVPDPNPVPDPTPVPPPTGSVVKPVARFDVVPLQRINKNETFNFGVVAFSKAGINRVEFTVSGQGYNGQNPLISRSMTYNPQTDTYEYWVPIQASSFLTGGAINVKAVAYGNDGGMRDLGNLVLFANPSNSLANPKAWVSNIGNNSTGVVGDSFKPFATIAGAISAIQSTNGGKSDGAIIYLENGTYSVTGVSANTSSEWLTITKSASATKENVIINSGKLFTSYLKYDSLTLQSRGGGLYVANDSSANLWTNNCRRIGSGRNVLDSNPVHHSSDQHYSTNDYTYDADYAYRKAALVRGATMSKLGNDAFANTRMVINSSVDDMDNTTGWHSDVYQSHTANEPPADNRIIYNLKATNVHYQGIFMRSDAGTSTDNAFVNVFVEMREPATKNESGLYSFAVFSAYHNWDHLIVWNSTFLTGDGEMPGTFTNSSFVGNIFKAYVDNRTPAGNSSLPYASAGNSGNNEFLYNHFYEVNGETPTCVKNSRYLANNWTCPHYFAKKPDSGSPATATVGNGVIDLNSSSQKFTYPVAGSVVIGRMSSVRVPVDVYNRPRGSVSDLGAVEYNSDSTPPPPSDTTPPTVSSPSPSGTLASGTTSTTLSVTTNETSVCKYSTTANTSYASMTNTLSASSNTHTATINNLTDGTTYNYYVKCSDTAGNTTLFDTQINFSVNLGFVDNQAPTNATISINSGSNLTSSINAVLTLSATDNVGVTQMQFSNTGLIYSDWENYTVTKNWMLSSGSGTKTVYVKYKDNAGNISSAVNDTIVLDTQAPVISDVVAFLVSSTSAKITWTTDENSTTQMEYGFTTNYGNQTIESAARSLAHSITLNNLSPDNTVYNFRVKSRDEAGNQAISINKTFITPGLTDIVSPSQITDFQVSDITKTSASFNWTAPGDDGTDGISASYDIRYSTRELLSSNWTDAISVTGEPVPAPSGSNQNLYVSVGLQPNTKYYFGIRSADDTGNVSPLSNVVSFTTLADTTIVPPPGNGKGGGNGGGGGGGVDVPDSKAPSQPADFRAISADKQITLVWKNPTESDFVRVIILRSVLPFTTFSTKLEDLKNNYKVVYEGKKQEYTDVKLNNGQIYYYAIIAYDRTPNLSVPLILSIMPISGVETLVVAEKEQPLTTDSVISPVINTIFSQNLWFGLNNDTVKKLQEFLAKDKTVYPEGIVSGFYGNMTIKAVQRFQSKYNIVTSGTPETTGYGNVGPKTRLKLNEIYGGSPVKTVSNIVRLTFEQITAIVNVLISFGTDNAIVDTVRNILNQ